jgi:bifunctional DNA-binding transcriptional regulator/antitoxin component of YhaV-PrlF toxin-antitoxin module
MAEEGIRKVQSKGEITLPIDFREENDIEPGDHVSWKRHSRDKTKLIIEVDTE